MPSNPKTDAIVMEIDRLALQLAKDPLSKAFLPLAEEYCKAGMWQEAVGVLEDGLKHYPGYVTAMVVLGCAYEQTGQLTKAKTILEEAVKLSPENLRAHRTLMRMYLAHGSTEEALRSCSVILESNPRDEEALSVQANHGTRTTAPPQPDEATPTNSSAVQPGSKKGGEAPTVATGGAAGEESGTHVGLSSQGKTIELLEKFLHSIGRNRRDRTPPNQASQTTS
jgi:Tfp pilus assembly protein PilF